MSEEKTTNETQAEGVSEEKETTTGEEILMTGEEAPVEETQVDTESEKMISSAQAIAKEIFEEKIKGLDEKFGVVELIPQFLDSYIKIFKGGSKQWHEVVQAQSAFFETKANEIEEYDEETKK